MLVENLDERNNPFSDMNYHWKCSGQNELYRYRVTFLNVISRQTFITIFGRSLKPGPVDDGSAYTSIESVASSFYLLI